MKFSEFEIGKSYETASYQMTLEEIQAFSRKFDPQYMHVDEVRANETEFGGIIASGIHTLNISFKLWIEVGAYGDEIIAGRQMDKVIFKKPVYPGDILRVIVKITDKKAIKGNRGLVTCKMTTYNQHDEKVLTAILTALIKDV
ncbi:MaoC family dehydratase [Pseudogracilibacillus sp. ICA-222130]|uniref:MaoC family dehydratase n=1 Tax=Pseudogracilibacillus sp. ICA-222130 TaxID=3134655 RepID=UPI0030BDB4FF